jgi:hypothetical protein
MTGYRGRRSDLTTKERRVIDALQREDGPITAFYLYDYAGVIRTDIVCGNLINKGLVRYGEWIETGCEVERGSRCDPDAFNSPPGTRPRGGRWLQPRSPMHGRVLALRWYPLARAGPDVPLLRGRFLPWLQPLPAASLNPRGGQVDGRPPVGTRV